MKTIERKGDEDGGIAEGRQKRRREMVVLETQYAPINCITDKRVQGLMLELRSKLETLGVIQMVEERTKEPGSGYFAGGISASTSRWGIDIGCRLAMQYDREFREFDHRWHETLYIFATRKVASYVAPEPRYSTDPPSSPSSYLGYDRVVISYTQKGKLTICGDNVVFSGSIPTDPVERQQVVGNAILEAFKRTERIALKPVSNRLGSGSEPVDSRLFGDLLAK